MYFLVIKSQNNLRDLAQVWKNMWIQIILVRTSDINQAELYNELHLGEEGRGSRQLRYNNDKILLTHWRCWL